MLNNKMGNDDFLTVYDRAKIMKQCPFGRDGRCCRNCGIGPCRITDAQKVGVCGASPETIAARNFARMVAAGTAAHTDHAREVIHVLLAAAKGEAPEFKIRDVNKLRMLADILDIDTKGKDTNQIAIEVGEKLLEDFGRQDNKGEINFIKRAPKARQELWRKLGIVPRGIDREIVEVMHRTHIGVDMDYKNILMHACRTALADGWGGSMIATELQDVLFGTPVPRRTQVNLGVLREDMVNIVIHGHEPMLPEVMVDAVDDSELVAMAKEVGAKGINLAGMCCTGNELLMRHGVPVAGPYLEQEFAIMTGAVEVMVVDVQCIMGESLARLAQCFHTELITTSARARISGVTHLQFEPETAHETAREIVRRAIRNFPNRKLVDIPKNTVEMVVGFSHETINYMQGGQFRASYRPLNDNIINGRIRGIAGIVGCNNPRVNAGYVHTTLMKELIANNVLVLVTGCAAINAARAGLLLPEAADKYAGSGLREVCEAIGIPPVLHAGSCVDNSRLLIAATAMEHEGGLSPTGDLYTIPAVGCAPEWMSEKAVAIGHYFVSSGIDVVFGVNFPTLGNDQVTKFLFEDIYELVKARWYHEPDPLEMARIIIEVIDAKRQAIGIDKKFERIYYDMEMRRKLPVE